MYLLNLSHLDKKPQHQNIQKPSRISTDQQCQVWQVSSAKVAADEAHQRGRHPFGKKELYRKPVLFSLERSVARGRGHGLAAMREGGEGREGETKGQWEGKTRVDLTR